MPVVAALWVGALVPTSSLVTASKRFSFLAFPSLSDPCTWRPASHIDTWRMVVTSPEIFCGANNLEFKFSKILCPDQNFDICQDAYDLIKNRTDQVGRLIVSRTFEKFMNVLYLTAHLRTSPNRISRRLAACPTEDSM